MLLKILLLQVMSIGLITLQTKAQDEMPELFMTDMDKVVMGKIWNIAGFSNGETRPDTQVERKFFKQLLEVAPQIAKSAQPFLARIPQLNAGVNAIGTLAPVVSGLMSGQRRNKDMKATSHAPFNMPSMTSSYGTMPYPMVAYPSSLAVQNNQNIQQYRVQPKPPNSELDSSEEDESPEGDVDAPISTSRQLHPENTDWEITEDDDDQDDEESEPGDLETEELPLERTEQRMQFKDTDATKVDTPTKTLKIRRTKNPRTSKNNSPTTLSPDVEQNTAANRNSHMETQRNNNNERKRYMHKKKYYRKTANTTRNASKRKESNKKPDKSLETRKYYEMLENNQKYMCKCNMDEEKYRRKNEELNGRKSYMERSMEFRHDQVFNCTKYCSATERKAAKTNDKANSRLRSRPDKDREHPRERYHKTKRENEGEDIEEQEAVRPKTTHSRRHRNKHRNHNEGSDKENIVDTHRGNTEGYFSSTSTEAEEMVNNENDKMYLPDENQFSMNAEYRSSIDPVEAYAEESVYRHRYPHEIEYHPAVKRHVDESDYEPQMNIDYRSIGDARMMKQNVHPNEYQAWSPTEVLQNVKGYNPLVHQYPYNPQLFMYEQMQDIRPTTVRPTQINKVTS